MLVTIYSILEVMECVRFTPKQNLSVYKLLPYRFPPSCKLTFSPKSICKREYASLTNKRDFYWSVNSEGMVAYKLFPKCLFVRVITVGANHYRIGELVNFDETEYACSFMNSFSFTCEEEIICVLGLCDAKLNVKHTSLDPNRKTKKKVCFIDPKRSEKKMIVSERDFTCDINLEIDSSKLPRAKALHYYFIYNDAYNLLYINTPDYQKWDNQSHVDDVLSHNEKDWQELESLCRKIIDAAEIVEKKFPEGVRKLVRGDSIQRAEDILDCGISRDLYREQNNYERIQEYKKVDEIRREQERIREQKRREEEEKKRREFELRQKREALQRLIDAVSGWRCCFDIPHHFFYYYYPKNRFLDSQLSPESLRERKAIYLFKDGFSWNSIKEMVCKKLKQTFSSSELGKLTFVCLPASTVRMNIIRYQKFSECVCGELGMTNAFSKITITKEKRPSHLGGNDEAEYSFDTGFFKGKTLVLFDDIVTSGCTMYNFKCQFEQMGAKVLCAISIGQTV